MVHFTDKPDAFGLQSSLPDILGFASPRTTKVPSFETQQPLVRTGSNTIE